MPANRSVNPVFSSIYRKFQNYGLPVKHMSALPKWAQASGHSSSQPKAKFNLNIPMNEDEAVELMIMDDIGEGFFGEGITPQQVIDFLADNPTRDIDVRINSWGGSVFDGLGIFNALAAENRKITTINEGMAASTAGFIAQVGNERKMFEGSMLMLHKAWSFAVGNQDEFLAEAAILGKVDILIADVFASRSGKLRNEVLEMMAGDDAADGVWLLPDEAKELGFVDTILSREDAQDVPPEAPDASEKAAKAKADGSDTDEPEWIPGRSPIQEECEARLAQIKAESRQTAIKAKLDAIRQDSHNYVK